MTISGADFERVDMRVGMVVDATEFPEAWRPASRLWIDSTGASLELFHEERREPWIRL